ncbi:MAG TPA: hypothetical protein VGM75_32445, partial [Pseudonocardiaceae bacterium]
MTVDASAAPVVACGPTLDRARPDAVLRGLTATNGLVVLCGAWAGGGLIVARDPIRVSASRDDVFGTDIVPGPEQAAGVGGGWFGWLPYPGEGVEPWFGLYPNIVRYRATDECWLDEALPGLIDDAALARRRRRAVALAGAA